MPETPISTRRRIITMYVTATTLPTNEKSAKNDPFVLVQGVANTGRFVTARGFSDEVRGPMSAMKIGDTLKLRGTAITLGDGSLSFKAMYLWQPRPTAAAGNQQASGDTASADKIAA